MATEAPKNVLKEGGKAAFWGGALLLGLQILATIIPNPLQPLMWTGAAVAGLIGIVGAL